MRVEIEQLAAQLGDEMRAQGLRLATAESCTGGWVSMVVTGVAGSSEWFDRGFVTYSNAAKQELLGVPAETLEAHGAVSEPTVCAMAEGAIAHSAADLSVAISGIAGPGGGQPDKPVGTVFIAWGRRGGTTRSQRFGFSGDREQVRRQAVSAALQGLVAQVAAAATE